MLAVEPRTDQLIVDDREGRKHAEERRIPVIGTLAYGRKLPPSGCWICECLWNVSKPPASMSLQKS